MKFGVHAGLWMAKWTDEIKPILKIVSDHMDMKHHISANQVESLIKQKIPVIDKFIKDLRKLQN